MNHGMNHDVSSAQPSSSTQSLAPASNAALSGKTSRKTSVLAVDIAVDIASDIAANIAANIAPLPPSMPPRPLLRQLGLIGMDAIEPLVIAALATQSPLLLIGPHGTAKSLLLCRLCEALGVTWRHYNASLLNYDDLVGYPLPQDDGTLRFVQTPASIWDAEAVFLDEISRCRPDMQNRLYSIIHEKRVQGLPIERLIFRWAAMNPPSNAAAIEQEQENYLGSEALDSALADRFNFLIEVPRWQSFSEADREALIRSEHAPVSKESSAALRSRVEAVQAEAVIVEAALGLAIAEYVRMITDQAVLLGLTLSGRRAAMLYRNVIAVHAARLVASPAANANDSAWLALEHSLPQRAEGTAIDRARLMLAHNNAWASVTLSRTDPRRLLMHERCAVRRAIRALGVECLSSTELSAYVADGLADVGPGGRHALAALVVNSPAADRLNAAVAEQAAELYALTAVAQSVAQGLAAGSPAQSAWREIVRVLATLSPSDPDLIAISNLLAGLFNKRDLTKSADVCVILDSWRHVRPMCASNDSSRQVAA